MKYVIQDKDGNYLTNDEDYMNGLAYHPELDEYTVWFDKEKDAQFNCESYEKVVAIEDEIYNRIHSS